jgi:hypothetical protein
MLLGYPRLLSGELKNRTTLQKMHEKTLFPAGGEAPHTYNPTTYRRHQLSFPMYPFRTLCPRDAQEMLGNSSRINEFDQTSPMFPANTKINIKFTRRANDTLINYMLPTNLNLETGPASNSNTAVLRTAATAFTTSVRGADPAGNIVNTVHAINSVTVNIQAMYLQVQCFQKNSNKTVKQMLIHVFFLCLG